MKFKNRKRDYFRRRSIRMSATIHRKPTMWPDYKTVGEGDCSSSKTPRRNLDALSDRNHEIWRSFNIYNCLRNKSRLCRRALGNHEHAQLVDEDAVRIYILRSLAFHAIFTDNCITFGSLYYLELHMPTELDLLVILGDVLSASKIIHLSLLCGHRHDYWQELCAPSWTPFLRRTWEQKISAGLKRRVSTAWFR